jgi:hypothetical protein
MGSAIWHGVMDSRLRGNDRRSLLQPGIEWMSFPGSTETSDEPKTLTTENAEHMEKSMPLFFMRIPRVPW